VSSSLTEKIKTHLTIPKVYSTFGMTETVSHIALKHINSSKEEPFKALERIHFSVNSKNCLVIHAPEITGIKNLETNDVVELVSPTEFNWLGRYDYIINSGGIKIHPETVEKEIAKLFSQKNCMNRFFVFGLPDERLGEALHMAVEGEIESMDIEDLIKKNLPPYHSPKKLFTVDQFIETESGKINRLKTIEDLKLKGFLG
jgi:O-succinylbenzoic acid--CoA ligase